MLTAAAASGKDYYLVTTQLHGAPAVGTPAQLPVVYVLLLPDGKGVIHPSVYTTFDSKDMEDGIRNIAPGSILYFNPTPVLEHPPAAQVQALADFCKKLGITLVVSQTA
jgi:hypothetical protein